VDELFTELDRVEIPKSKTVNVTIRVIKFDRASEFKLGGVLNFKISSEKELDYALSLMRFYQQFIKPFLRKHKTELDNKVDTFNRLFFVSGDLNHHLVGKSIVNTARGMDVFIHYTYGYMRVKGGGVELVHGTGNIADYSVNNRDFMVSRELAHLSHYRDFDQFDVAIPFSAFHFDLNYFKCYLMPMLSEK
jgi:hypothetical protein